MNVIGLFKCAACGWVYFDISELDATQEVNEFNGYFGSLTEEEQHRRYGGRSVSIERYKRCSRCGNPSENFRPAEVGDCPIGVTLQAIIAPSSNE